jgi:hypothetical protein
VMVALSSYWMVGWVVGAVVIALVAVLLITITALARKIDVVALDLVTDLDSIARKTNSLQEAGAINGAVQTITRCLRKARGGEAVVDRYHTSPGWRP